MPLRDFIVVATGLVTLLAACSGETSDVPTSAGPTSGGPTSGGPTSAGPESISTFDSLADTGNPTAAVAALVRSIGEHVGESGSPAAVACTATTTYETLSPETLAAISGTTQGATSFDLRDLSGSEVDSMVTAMFACGLFRDALGPAATEAGVVLADEAATCISDAAAVDPNVRQSIAESFTRTQDATAPRADAADAAFDRIAIDCGVSRDDLAKLNQ
jgi:hypothetical protein